MKQSHRVLAKGDLGVLKAQIDLFERVSFECDAEGRGTQDLSVKASQFRRWLRRAP